MAESIKRTITLPLIRKRSEHNEGLVSTLEELALHQEELQAIGPIVGRTCGKTLRILLLQNNVIERMDPSEMKYFKVLEYLNLALNNITSIEGLSGMECLKKLDLTLNFIPVQNLESSVDDLMGCPMLEELFLIGNPCMGVGDDGKSSNSQTDDDAVFGAQSTAGWSGCRLYIIARLSSLKFLDGKEVKRSERIVAMQKLPHLKEELRGFAKHCLDERGSPECDEFSANDSGVIGDDEPTHHNPQTRTKISNELYAQKQSKEQQETAHLVPQKGEKDWQEEHKAVVDKVREREVQDVAAGNKLKANGEIKQCNQGKWKFWFEESGTAKGSNGILTMTISLPKHLSTSLIDVDIHPTYVSVIVKSKILRVILPVDVISDRSAAKRIASSGHLELIMPKANPGEVAIGMPHVRGSKSKDSSIGGHDSGSQMTASTGTQNATKRERLGHALLQEAITAESLGSIVVNPKQPTHSDDEDEPPSLF
jgi:protein TilB